MVDEKRKTTVPIPSVGADGEQPILNTTTGIITGDKGEINYPDEISQENFLEFQRFYDRLNNPAYLHTVTLSELYETSSASIRAKKRTEKFIIHNCSPEGLNDNTGTVLHHRI